MYSPAEQETILQILEAIVTCLWHFLQVSSYAVLLGALNGEKAEAYSSLEAASAA